MWCGVAWCGVVWCGVVGVNSVWWFGGCQDSQKILLLEGAIDR